MIPIRLLSEVNGKIWRISKTKSFSAATALKVMSAFVLSTKARPIDSAHSVKAISSGLAACNKIKTS